ncbi:MAG: tetratricopeptide repeat protein [Elusimicrobia bacterium]|nr:tetratricopeptide repeat protein [Elusimicrobiota bacterium]
MMLQRIVGFLSARPTSLRKTTIALGALAIGLWVTLFLDSPESRLTRQHSSKDANYFYRLSKVYDQQKDYRKVLEAAQRAVEIDPDFGKAHIMLGVALIERGEFRRAMGVFESAREKIKNDPSNLAVINVNLGVIHWKERNPELSWEYYNKALPWKASVDRDAWIDSPRKNTYYVERNDKEGFMELYRQSHKGEAAWGWPEQLKARHREATTDSWWPGSREKRYRENKEMFFKNIGSPYDYVYAAIFSVTLRQMGRWEEAVKVLRWMEKLLMSDAYREWRVESEGWVLRATGQTDRAVRLVDKFSGDFPELMPTEEALLVKADLYEEAGRYQEQQKALREVVRLCPDCDYALTAMRLLHNSFLHSGHIKEASDWFFKAQEMERPRTLELGMLRVFVTASFVLLFYGGLFILLSRSFFSSKRASSEKRFRTWHAAGILYAWLSFPVLAYVSLVLMGSMTGCYIFNPLFAPIWTLAVLSVIIIFLWRREYGFTMQEAGWSGQSVLPSLGLSLGAVFVVSLIRYGYELALKARWTWPMHYTELYAAKTGIVAADLVTHLVFWGMVLVIIPFCAAVFLYMYLFNFIKRWTNVFWAVLICGIVGASSIFVHPVRGFGIFVAVTLLGIVYARSRLLWPCLAGCAAIVFFLIL